MTTTKTPYCYQCHKSFETWLDLATHYLGMNKRKHNRKAFIWAQRYILTEKKKPERVVLTQEQKETRASLRIELSGEQRVVQTICLRGKHNAMQSLPVEYINSEHAWRIKGTFVVTCPYCMPDKGMR